MPTPVADPVEAELKFALGPGARAWLEAGLLRDGDTSSLLATYFDTSDFTLLRNGYVLRVRQKGARFVQTLKSEGDGLLARGEWEADVATMSLDAEALARTPAGALVTTEMLRPMFEVAVRRTTRVVTQGASRIEAALDIGEVRAGDRSEAVEELELELVTGDPGDLFALARSLDGPLTLAFDTKSHRGYRLAGVPLPPHAGPLGSLRRLSAAVREGDSATAAAAARELGVTPPPVHHFNQTLWANLLLNAAERLAFSGTDTPT